MQALLAFIRGIVVVFSASSDADYLLAQRAMDRTRSRVMLGYVGFAYPTFFVLDLVVFPERRFEFGVIRALHALVAIPAFFFAAPTLSGALVHRLAIGLSITATLCVAGMCAVTGGFESIYLVGMIICFLAIATIEVLRPAGLLIALAAITLSYCGLNVLFGGPVDMRHAVAAISFVVGASLFCTVAAALLETQRRQLFAVNARLVQQNAELERARGHQRQFLSTVSHELRSPVNSILGFVELVEDRERNLHAKSRANLERVRFSAVRLLRFINDLLDLSKAEAGRMEIDVQRFDLVPVVQDIAEATRALVVGRCVDVLVRAPEQLFVNTDEARVRQILINLTSNAAKFTEGGSITITLSHNSGVVLEVSDTGLGIAEEHRTMIFEAFRQAHRGMTAGGTGLGLSIVSHMTQLLGARIELESSVGEGSLFRLRLGDIEAREAA